MFSGMAEGILELPYIGGSFIQIAFLLSSRLKELIGTRLEIMEAASAWLYGLVFKSLESFFFID